MIQTKIIAVIVLIAIATIGAVGIGIGMATQSAHAICFGGFGDPDDRGHGQSCHDINGDIHSHGHA